MQFGALAHSCQAEAAFACGPGIESPSVVFDHHGCRPFTTDEQNADVGGLRMLDDVGQRFLDDSIQRCLDFGRQPLVSELRFERDPNFGRFREGLHQSLERRYEAEVVERFRPQLNSQATDVLQRRDYELAQVRRGLTQVTRVGGVFDRSKAEEDRGRP